MGVSRKYYTEEEDEYRILIKIAVPGVKTTKDIKVTITKTVVKVYFAGNQFCDSFLYVYKIPNNIIKEEAYADLTDGVLEVFIPKNLEK